MIQPTPTKPRVPTLRGPSSHSPLPIEIPRAIRLGPRTNFTTSLRPRWGTPKTSSGSGRSTTGNGSPTPSGWVVVWSGGGDVTLSMRHLLLQRTRRRCPQYHRKS